MCLIRNWYEDHRFHPSCREIADAAGMSLETVYRRIRSFEKGYIQQPIGKERRIFVTEKGILYLAQRRFWQFFGKIFGHSAHEYWTRSGLTVRKQFVRMLRYRRSRWLAAKPVQNYSFIDPSWGKLYRFSCSQPECHRRSGTTSGLRMTPTGIFCEEHYMTLPVCRTPGCLEPATIDPDWNVLGYCRSCDPELAELPPPASPREFSSLFTLATE